MSILDFIKKELIEIIEWTDDSRDTLSYRWPDEDRQIKNGAQLIVRESQMVQFVAAGQYADLFGPGKHTLSTQNIPVLSTILGWKYGFESPFKCDVYYLNTRLFTGNKWGTANPVMMRDADFGVVRLRAFGIYAFHLSDPKAFHTTLSGTLASYGSEQLEGQLRNTIVGHISDIFGESGVPFIDMAGNQDEFGKALKAKLDPMFLSYGLTLDSLNVQNISLPEELQAMLDKRIGVNMMGGMQAYTQFQTAEAIPLAAQNEGGLAGLGAGVGVGFGMGQQIAGAMGQALNPAAAPAAAPAAVAPAPTVAAPVSADEIVASIEKLHGLVGKGILSQAEFDAKKAELLKKLG